MQRRGSPRRLSVELLVGMGVVVEQDSALELGNAIPIDRITC